MEMPIKFWVYKDERFRWVFDDAKIGLSQEVFVAGMDDLIDLLVKDIPEATNGFMLYMDEWTGTNDHPFIVITHATAMTHPKLGQSNYYWCNELNKKVWLCNNLYRYIDHTPQVLCFWATKN